MGDETIIVEAPSNPPESNPDPMALWHAEHEARHAEHMAHLETIRNEWRSEASRLQSQISELQGQLAALVIEEIMEPDEPGTSMGEALDTVREVGEVIADISQAVNQPEEVNAPSPPSGPPSNNSAPDDGEVVPDAATSQSPPPPANAGRRKGGFW